MQAYDNIYIDVLPHTVHDLMRKERCRKYWQTFEASDSKQGDYIVRRRCLRESVQYLSCRNALCTYKDTPELRTPP